MTYIRQHTYHLWCIVLVSCCAAFFVPFLSSPASGIIEACPDADANTFIVSSTADSGVGSLRNAFDDAYSNNGGTICVEEDLGTIHLDSQISFQSATINFLRINGNGVTIDAEEEPGSEHRIFDIRGGEENNFPLYINDVTFRNGEDHDGGAVYLYDVKATIADSKFLSNTAQANSVGGAIYIGAHENPETNERLGSLAIYNTHFESNTANCPSCVQSDGGGAIQTYDVALLISNSSFQYNHSSGPGGAISVVYGRGAIITNSTFITNSTIDGQHNEGGAIYATSLNKFILAYNTISGNYSPDVGSALFLDEGSNTQAFGNIFTFSDVTPALCNTPLISQGYNYSNDHAESCGFDATGDDDSSNPQPNGVPENGPNTVYFVPEGYVVDAIPSVNCHDIDSQLNINSNFSQTPYFAELDTMFDQIGTPRPNSNGEGCTPGSIEVQGETEETTTTSTTTTSTTTTTTTTTTTAPTTTTTAPPTTTTAPPTTTTSEPVTTTTSPEAPTGDTDNTSSPGQEITVSGEGFMPDSDVTVSLHSTPVLLGTAHTNSNGSFTKTFMIPTSATLGQHTIVLQGVNPDGDPTTLTLGITLVQLPATGSTAMPIILPSLGLLGVGMLLLQTVRRRRGIHQLVA